MTDRVEGGGGEVKEEEVAFLNGVVLFAGLTEVQIRRLLAMARLVDVEAGHTLIREGERGDSLYVIRNGEVEVSKNLTLPWALRGEGQQEKALTRLTDRDRAVFGELALFDEDTRSATVRCLTPCSFYELKGEPLLQLAESDLAFGCRLFRNLAQMISLRLRRSSDDVVKLTTALSIALSR